jgi:Ca2+-binding EF-hand superfamily protein
VLHLEDLLKETRTNRAKFLAFMGVEKIEEVPAVRYKEALNVFDKKKEGK